MEMYLVKEKYHGVSDFSVNHFSFPHLKHTQYMPWINNIIFNRGHSKQYNIDVSPAMTAALNGGTGRHLSLNIDFD